MPWRSIAAMIVALLVIGGGALPVQSQAVRRAVTYGAYFVEFASPPLEEVDGRLSARQLAAYFGRLADERQTFRRAARAAGVAFRERRAFFTLFNGLSVDVAPAHVAGLARLPGVRRIWPVLTFSIPPIRQGNRPELATALAMTGADVARSELGLTGQGIKVAVMDTGLDYTHPDLGGPGTFPTARVIAGWDFVGDDFNADSTSPTFQPIAKPDPDPRDCNGHGTHVSGIIGARAASPGGVTGVAPNVRFGAYRVFGCDGSTFADVMLQAMEQVLRDGMDVLNMSIGAAFQWPEYPTAVGSDRLVDAGIVVVASFGNSGANGLYSGSAPGVGRKVIGVGSLDNTHTNALTFLVDPGGRQVPYIGLATTPDAPTSGTSGPVVYVGQGCLADPYLADPQGKVALIVRGVCTFNEKYQRAFAAGATGVVIHNNAVGLFSGGGVTPRTIFGIGISQADGLAIRALLDGGSTVNIQWTATIVSIVNPTGGLSSSFTSYGLPPDLSIKPDITAPGGLIRSTYFTPTTGSTYRIVSGTSMSSPHVAGAAALFLEAYPGFPAGSVRDVLMNYGRPILWWGNPGLGYVDNVHRQGAGLLQIDEAITGARHMMLPAKLPLSEGSGPHARRLTIVNQSTQARTYDLSFVPALSTGPNTFTPQFFDPWPAVTFSSPVVAVGPGSSASVDVTIAPNAALPDRSLYGGYIVATPRGEGLEALRVPYAGFKGDYQSIQALVTIPTGIPNVTIPCVAVFFRAEDCRPNGFTFRPTTDPNDVVFVLFHLDHAVQRATLEVFSHPNNLAFGAVFSQDFLRRNSTATEFFSISWDGRRPNGQLVPDGFYVLRLTVQKALGDPTNPLHFETWTSPPIEVRTVP